MLIVEDEPFIALALEATLLELGFDVAGSAAQVSAALELIGGNRSTAQSCEAGALAGDDWLARAAQVEAIPALDRIERSAVVEIGKASSLVSALIVT